MAGFINLTHTNNKAIDEVKQSVEDLKTSITGVYHYKGSVQNYADLPANASVGDVYNVVNAYGDYGEGTNFAWNGSQWDALGGIRGEDVDLSDYVTEEELIAKGYLTNDKAVTIYETKSNAGAVKAHTTVTRYDADAEQVSFKQYQYSNTTDDGVMEVSNLLLVSNYKTKVCNIKDATARADIANLNTRVDDLENAPDIDLSGYVTEEELDAKGFSLGLMYTGYVLAEEEVRLRPVGVENQKTGTTRNLRALSITTEDAVRNTYKFIDEDARSNITTLTNRIDTLEEAIGDIGTLLDTINGEVI
ncbi:MAG: hypothetical protein J6A98_00735 [Clostridia bacterium]|nr:hypothetical protein [Clostridia bacterium]